MKKIPTIFDRDWAGDRSRVVDVPHPDCGWVFAGEGWATRKIDGTCCMVRGGVLFKRREASASALLSKPIPNFEVAEHDSVTDKVVGWVPVSDGPEDRWHREAFEHLHDRQDGTYELVGPKIQGNPEGYVEHALIPHNGPLLAFIGEEEPERDFQSLKEWLAIRDIEGLVFHHSDGRMAKIKRRDFGLDRKAVAAHGLFGTAGQWL